MRVVVLTEAAGPATRALLQLSVRGISASAVVVAPRPTASAVTEFAAVIRARSPRRIVGSTLRRAAAILDPPARFGTSGPFEGLVERVVVTQPLNSPAMVRALESVEPEVLLLAATGLVTADVLAAPRQATLNSHPGLLPWIRGNGAIEHSIRQRIPVGISVHHVDLSADTGDTILRQLVPVTPADTLNSIHQKADELRWGLLADVVKQMMSGAAPSRTAQTGRFPSSRWPTGAERADAERLVAEGDAYRRYCAWREIAGGDVLPDADAMFDSRMAT